eukprot:jgi/Tetstr1/466756/TSEL_011226.t1
MNVKADTELRLVAVAGNMSEELDVTMAVPCMYATLVWKSNVLEEVVEPDLLSRYLMDKALSMHRAWNSQDAVWKISPTVSLITNDAVKADYLIDTAKRTETEKRLMAQITICWNYTPPFG